MSRQKQKGTAFETESAKGLSERLGVEVRRNPLMASLDQGDLHGIYIDGEPFVVECKDHKKYDFAGWQKELDREMECAETDIGCVLFHRNGIGIQRIGEQGVYMNVDILCRLLEKIVDRRDA